MQKKAVVLFLAGFFLLSLAEGLQAKSATVSFESNLGGSARHGLISGTNLYSLMGSRLHIADISSISTPVELSSIALPGIARRIAQSGSVLYISCTTGGLAAVDVADPANPHILSVTTFDKPDAIGQTFGVTVKDNYVYVADYSGAFVLDVTDPANPVKAGEFIAFDREHHNAYDAYVDNNTLYISCEMDGLYIFDISTPTQLNKIARYADPAQGLGQFYGCLRDGNYLYVAAGGAGFAILDVSDLANPSAVSVLDNNFQGVLGVVKAGDFVYLCSEFQNFYKIDVSDPAAPFQAAQFLVGANHSLGISKTGDYVVLANSNHGIRIFDSRAAGIRQVGEVLSLGRVVDCKGAGDFAYAAVGVKGLAVLDMSNPAQPVQVAQKNLQGYANGLAVDGTTVFVAATHHEGEDGGMLEIVDVADPQQPVILATVALTGQPFSVQVKGSVAIVSCQTTGVAVIDVDDPSSPELLGMHDTAGVSYAPLLWGDYVLAADGLKGFTVIDIKDPASPRKVAGDYDLGNAVDIALWDNWLYLPTSDAVHIATFDPLYLPQVDNATIIEPVTERNRTGQLKAVSAFDGYLLVADSVGGVRLFDIAQPNDPQEIDSETYLDGDPLRLSYAADQGLAYISSQIAGLYIYSVGVPDKAAVDANGIWLGEGMQGEDAVGMAADLYQAHGNVTGTITLYGQTVLAGSITASVNEQGSITGTIVYPDSSSGAITLAKTGNSLTGSITGSPSIENISLDFATPAGLLSFKNIAPGMDSAIATALETAKGPKKRRLGLAQKMMAASAAQAGLEGQLRFAALATAMTGPGAAAGALAASEALLYQSALWETSVMQAEAGIMAATICDDYKKFMNLFLRLGDRMLAKGQLAGERGRLGSALSAFSAAARYYGRVAAQYEENIAACPVWGEAVFDGYYEGIIDFGFIAASFKVCAAQADNGTVTGEVRIDIEASNEHMNGKIADADDVAGDPEVEDIGKNITEDEVSTVTGTILVHIGEITAHIVMQDWKYNIVTDQWVGIAQVLEQDVAGNVSLKKVSDTCPEGFPEN